MATERLHKILAAAGIDSRRNCEQLIIAGLVRVNGRVVDTLPAFADTETDVITVNGQKLRPPRKVHYLLNKPKGVLCTNYGPEGRRKAPDLIDCEQRILCVGRLDTNTSGAIILTSDTSLADKLIRPHHWLSSTYIAAVKGKITPESIEKLQKGIWLSEGKIRPSKVKLLKAGHIESTLEIKITQEPDRIQRILSKVGYKTVWLKRTEIGKISLHHLGTGRYRELTSLEVEYLKGI